MNLLSIGSGFSALEVRKQSSEKVLVLQEVFPNCIEYLDIVPDYWVSGDPNGYIEGFRYLLDNRNRDIANMEILVPSFFTGDFELYRQYCGTTPLMKKADGWSNFQDLLHRVENIFKVTFFRAVSTKYIKLYSKQNWDRFHGDDVIFGSVEFDNEIVFGDRYKWGLENKLTSTVLPVCHYLKSTRVRLAGFDYTGPRFYSNDARHPWDSESQLQTKDKVLDFSLAVLNEWLQLENVHGMKIFSATKNTQSLPNRFLQYLGDDDEHV